MNPTPTPELLLAGALTEALDADCLARIASGLATLQSERAGFLDLLEDLETPAACAQFATEAPPFQHVIVVGIGGSALPARLVAAASGSDALTVLDTVDPDAVERAWGRASPDATLLLGISKSGRTLEPLAVWSVLEQRMEAALGAAEARARSVVVCGEEEDNPMRVRAQDLGLRIFDIPARVGGRYSALTPVGLLPAALVGMDPRAFVAGGASLAARLTDPDPRTNVALALGGAHLQSQEAGRSACLLWAYGERLAPVGAWWVQLVSESLGKRGRQGPEGPLPLAARGPADQHSLLQRLLDGPDDTLVTLVGASSTGLGPAVLSGETQGHALGTVLEGQRAAMARALEDAKRPALALHLPDVGEASLGAFLVAWQAAVAAWGMARGIDPFNQPAVSRGKQAVLDHLRALAPEPSVEDEGG